MSTSEVRKLWRHRSGDSYVTCYSRIVGNQQAGFTKETYGVDGGQVHPSLAAARKAGFRAVDSHDFNIVAVRGGRVAAVLWMNEVVDDEPDVLAKYEAALRLGKAGA